MTRRIVILAAAAAAMLTLLALAGCGGDKAKEATTPPAETTATATPEAATEMAQTHDCDGGCGMTDVPLDKLTEIDGKFYCQGCAKKVQAQEAKDTPAPHDG